MHIRYLFLIFSILLLPIEQSYSQEIRVCAFNEYLGSKDILSICGEQSPLNDLEAENIIENILSKVGLYKNFIVKECPNISNAVALNTVNKRGVIDRYILFDKRFLSEIENLTKNYWSSISVLAHEIGHHLNGHTLSDLNNHDAELQADKFSGFVLAKMGASLSESLSCMQLYGNKFDTESHPNKFKRIEFIKLGWMEGNNDKINRTSLNTYEVYVKNEDRVRELVDNAFDLQKNQNYYLAAKNLIEAYKFSGGKEPIYLYYAGNNFVNGKAYLDALVPLEYLYNLGWRGDYTYYTLFNKETGERERFGTKQAMESYSKMKKFKKPKVLKEDSKYEKIASLIARIYIDQKLYGKAIPFIDAAKAANPNDIDLLLSEANMYYQMGEKEKAISILEKTGKVDRPKPGVYNNIGIMYAEIENTEKAVESYKTALEIDSEYNEARINMIAAMLGEERALIDEMNNLGMNKKDNARYDELDAQRKDLYKKVLPYLKKAMEVDPENKEIVKTAMNLYTNLDQQEKADALKDRL